MLKLFVMRYLRYTLIILLAFTVSLGMEAKKVKLGKNIVYNGAVLNNKPSGEGEILLETVIHYTSGNQHNKYFSIQGDFEGNAIKNAKLYRYDGSHSSYKTEIYSGIIKYAITKDNGKTMLVLQLGENGGITAFSEGYKWGGKKWLQEDYDDYGKIESLFTQTQNTVSAPKTKVNKSKIKFTKNVAYVGKVLDGIASGQGVLTVLSLNDKKKSIVTISGDFKGSTIYDATIQINGGLTIKSTYVSYKIADYSKYEDITVTATKCKIQSFLETSGSVEILCRCNFKNKSTIFFNGENTTPSYNGSITSNFNTSVIPSIAKLNTSDIVKQDISFKLQATKKSYMDDGVQIAILRINKSYMASGLEISSNSGYEYKYPNGSYIKTRSSGSALEYMYIMNGGKIKKNPTGDICIKYDNGDVFKSNDECGVKLPEEFIGNCSDIKKIELVEGMLSHKDKTSESYEKGKIICRTYPLSDGCSFSIFEDGCNALTYPDGSVFKANSPNGLVSHKSDSIVNTSADYTLLSGILTDSEGSEIEYKDGIPHYKYIYDLPQASASNPYSKIKEDMDRYLALYNNDAVGYFNIADVKTELQKRAFKQRPDYTTDYLPKLQEARKHLINDELLIWISIDNNIRDFEYNINTGRFNFEVRDTKNKKINANCKDFHFLIDDYLCLSYPRSLISMTSGKNYFDDMLYIQKAQTCKVNETDALKFDNNKKNCALVWTFKVEKIVKMELDGWVRPVLYGKTTHLYLANEETEEIYCDLTESLGASQNGFKSSKVIKDNSPKKTYHARGRQENCGVCLGTGQGWQGGLCPFCGGKGWRIEHYW